MYVEMLVSEDRDVLSTIPGEILGSACHDLPEAMPDGPDTQSVVVRLPDGTHARVIFARLRSKGKTTRWFWTPASAVLVK